MSLILLFNQVLVVVPPVVPTVVAPWGAGRGTRNGQYRKPGRDHSSSIATEFSEKEGLEPWRQEPDKDLEKEPLERSWRKVQGPGVNPELDQKVRALLARQAELERLRAIDDELVLILALAVEDEY